MKLTLINNQGFLSGLLAYGASEAAAKASRLATVIVIARMLDAESVGLAAAAMAASEILKSLTENGVGQRIISAREEDLDGVCRTAHRIFWAWCLGLFTLQAMVALGYWMLTGQSLVALMILILGAEYLFMPGGLVQCALAMREKKLTSTAAVGGGQIVSSNLLTALFVLIWPSPLSVVLPKLLTAPIWLIGMRRLRPWRPNRAATPLSVTHFTGFGLGVMMVEITKASRLHIDKLIIGALLGAEALGIYFLAFNAGLGIAQSFTQAFATALFPHLATAQNREAELARALKLALGLLVPVVILQALAAPIYIPILLGEGWEEVAPLAATLCLAAIPALVWTAAASRLRAAGRTGAEFRATLVVTISLALSAVIAAPFGLMAVVCGYLAAATVTQIYFAWPVIRPCIFPSTQEV